MPGYAHIRDLISLEVEQRIREGGVIDRDEWHDRLRACPASDAAAMRALYDELAAIDPPLDVPFDEPASLKVIREVRPNGVRDLGDPPDPRRAFDQVHGGWIGLCIGAMMGLPFERPPYTVDPETQQHLAIRKWLVGADAWPMTDYAPAESRGSHTGLRIAHPEATREKLRNVEPCDALHDALAAVAVLEDSGPGFDTPDVARVWLGQLPFGHTRRAQSQAYMNLLNEEATALTDTNPEALALLDWERIATRLNPWREGNGAMVRGLAYGLSAPGKPAEAAARAWRDARLAHTRNGLYAAMFAAALAAAAFMEENADHLVEIGLSEIPPSSRLAGAVRELIGAAGELGDWEACRQRMLERHGAGGADQAIPNTLLWVMALMYGGWELTESAALGVRGGLNPSANAAMAAAVAGIRQTSRGLPPSLVAPLNNSYHSHMPGAIRGTISDLARRCQAASQSK